MQHKTISKIIKAKILAWISTIKNDDLKKELLKNVLVSGGSIASMFLNEKVNDFDVYIKDIDVLKNLATYYANEHGVEVFDGREKQDLLDDVSYTDINDGDFDEFNCGFKATRKRVAIESLCKNQIKFFMQDGAGKAVNLDVSPESMNFTPLFFSPNAISLSDDLQIVVRFHGDDKEIHSTFDFVHATNYWTLESGLVTNKEALESLLCKQLKYQGSLYPLTTIIRIKKFLKRGWNISAGEQLKVMFQIAEFDLTNPEVLENQLIGVDVAYFSTLIDCLRGVKKEQITSQYFNALIDRVFNDDDTESDL